jgi:hypothetical protein
MFRDFMNQINSQIQGFFFYKNDARIFELIKTIQTFTPNIHTGLVYHDLTNKSFDDMPRIVKQIQQLPILVLKGINKPLVGIIEIQKWLSNQINISNKPDNEYSNSKLNSNKNEKEPIIFKNEKDGPLGFFPEMNKLGSNYSYLIDDMNNDMSCKFERLTSQQSNVQSNQQNYPGHSTGGFKEKKTDIDTNKKFDEMMNERKRIIEIRHNENTIPI